MLSRVNMLARIYEIKDELILFFEAQGKQDLLLSIESKDCHLKLGNPVDIFEALNILNLILQGKNISRINDYDVNNAFVGNYG